MPTCERPSCGGVHEFLFRGLCPPCACAEMDAEWNIRFDQLAVNDAHYEEHRRRHDRQKKLAHPLRMVKATDDPRGTRYGIVAMRNIIARLVEREDRNNALYAASCQIGELVAGGQIDGQYALDTLEEAAECVAPDERAKSKNTIARGVRVGLENPKVPRRAA